MKEKYKIESRHFCSEEWDLFYEDFSSIEDAKKYICIAKDSGIYDFRIIETKGRKRKEVAFYSHKNYKGLLKYLN